ncbi:MAG: hypothetical protein R2848_05125 [Thermomicrobiales bacterium]
MAAIPVGGSAFGTADVLLRSEDRYGGGGDRRAYRESAGSSAGLGHAISLYSASLKTPYVFACVLVLALMAIGLFGASAVLERVAMPWRTWVVE